MPCRRVQFWLQWMIALALLLGAGPAGLGADKAPAPHPIFDGTNILRLRLTIPASGMQKLEARSRSRFNNPGSYERPVAFGTLEEGGRIYTNVSIAVKGTSSFRPVSDKPALTLNLDKVVKGQKLHGLDKFSLNNSVQDPTYLSERVCREQFAKAGVAVPRAGHALVTLNGRDLGLYVLVEGFNKQFLRQHFKDASGNLYESNVMTDVNERMEVDSGDDPEDRSALRRLLAELEKTRQTGDLSGLEKALDIDQFLTFLAMEIILCHCDSYGLNRNNYRLFHDKAENRMVFLPHGMDRTFGIGNRCTLDIPLLPPMKALPARTVLNTEEGRARYMRRAEELVRTVFDAEAAAARTRELASLIQPVLAPEEAAFHPRAVARLCRNILARGRNLGEQLADPASVPAYFDFRTGLKLDEWSPAGAKDAERRQVTTLDGRDALHLSASPSGGAPSWRSKALLKPGAYVFEGLVKTRGAGPDNGSGAYLRVSGVGAGNFGSTNPEWKTLMFGFEIRDGPAEVEFVCEWRGPEGEAWFDLESLRVRQLDSRSTRTW